MWEFVALSLGLPKLTAHYKAGRARGSLEDDLEPMDLSVLAEFFSGFLFSPPKCNGQANFVVPIFWSEFLRPGIVWYVYVPSQALTGKPLLWSVRGNVRESTPHFQITERRQILETSQDWVLVLIDDGESGHTLKSANGQNWAKEG